MSELKATPGEWVTFEYDDLFGNVIVEVTTPERQKRNLIPVVEVEIGGELVDGLEKEQIANSNLIRTSKDLYKTVEDTLSFLEKNLVAGQEGLDLLIRCRSVLSQARGESQST